MSFWDSLVKAVGFDKPQASDTASAQYGQAKNYEWGKLGKNSDARQEYNKRAGMEQGSLAQAQASYDQSQQARGEQQRMLGEYQQMAAGKGPSLAREQAFRGLGQAQAQATQTAASARGGGANALLANRAAQQQGAQMALASNQQAIENTRAEQLAAMEAQAGIASNMRGGDLSTRGQDLGQANAQMDAQFRIADAQQKGKIAATQSYNQAVQFDTAQDRAAEEANRAKRAAMTSAVLGGISSGGMSVAASYAKKKD
jgi:hypothetical protein